MTERLLEALTNMHGTHALALVMLILLLCGLGLPIPEEIPIIAAGYLAYLEVVSLPIVIVMTLSAILIGDSTLYFFGWKFGNRIFAVPPFKTLLTPERMKMANGYFQRWGSRVVFVARFLAGVRATVYLTAGVLKMPYRRFILLDGAAATLSIPLNLYLVHRFGEEIDDAIRYVRKFGRTAMLIALISIAGVSLIIYLRKRRSAVREKVEV